MDFANRMKLFCLDGINFIATFVRFLPCMYCVSKLRGYSGVRRYQKISCFPKDNGNGEIKKRK